MVVRLYTDASYSYKLKTAACGFVILERANIIKHEVTLVENMPTNNEAEAYAVYLGLCEAYLVKGVTSIFVYTDSQLVNCLLNLRCNPNR